MNHTPELNHGDTIRNISNKVPRKWFVLFKRCYEIFGYSSQGIKGSNSSPEAVVSALGNKVRQKQWEVQTHL